MNKSLLVKTLTSTNFNKLSLSKLLKLQAVLLEKEEETKVCPKCGYNKFASFSSLQIKMCTCCWTKFDWKLGENEQPLTKQQR